MCAHMQTFSHGSFDKVIQNTGNGFGLKTVDKKTPIPFVEGGGEVIRGCV